MCPNVPRDSGAVPRVCGPTKGHTRGHGHIGTWLAVKKMTKHRHRNCQNCRQTIIAALNHWAAAYTVHCDPWPLNRLGEVETLRAGLRTYQVHDFGVRHRNAYRISDKPPSPSTTVLGEHRCGHVIPKQWRQSPPVSSKPTNTRKVPY